MTLTKTTEIFVNSVKTILKLTKLSKPTKFFLPQIFYMKIFCNGSYSISVSYWVLVLTYQLKSSLKACYK